mmetsp:Transcript_3766/g.8973  ORF Transcript_3766/g.8973 Transcript_3766/m.8973 type:complete len:225 (+) Transcript_3766:355-1029(+)
MRDHGRNRHHKTLDHKQGTEQRDDKVEYPPDVVVEPGKEVEPHRGHHGYDQDKRRRGERVGQGKDPNPIVPIEALPDEYLHLLDKCREAGDGHERQERDDKEQEASPALHPAAEVLPEVEEDGPHADAQQEVHDDPKPEYPDVAHVAQESPPRQEEQLGPGASIAAVPGEHRPRSREQTHLLPYRRRHLAVVLLHEGLDLKVGRVVIWTHKWRRRGGRGGAGRG